MPALGLNDSSADHIANDNYVIISHSLGSRIVIDGTQRIASMLATPEKYFPANQKITLSTKAIAGIAKQAYPHFHAVQPASHAAIGQGASRSGGTGSELLRS